MKSTIQRGDVTMTMESETPQVFVDLAQAVFGSSGKTNIKDVIEKIRANREPVQEKRWHGKKGRRGGKRQAWTERDVMEVVNIVRTHGTAERDKQLGRRVVTFLTQHGDTRNRSVMGMRNLVMELKAYLFRGKASAPSKAIREILFKNGVQPGSMRGTTHATAPNEENGGAEVPAPQPVETH